MLLEKGFSVTVNYRQDEEAVACLKADYPGCHDRLQFVKGDVTRKEDLMRIADAALQRFGRIDILINNAGTYLSAKSLPITPMTNGMACLKGI